MRARCLPTLLVASLASVALAACSSPAPTPSPTPSISASPSAEPTTLEELATALQDEGVADVVVLREAGGSEPSLQVQLGWSGTATTQQQLDAYDRVGERVDALLGDRPETTTLAIGSSSSDIAQNQILSSTFDPGRAALEELLDVVHDSPCARAMLEERDEGDGPMTLLQLSCVVPADDAVALAGAYDELTALQPAADVVDRVRWELRPEHATSSSPTLRIDEGPVAGRQQLLVDALSVAEEGGDVISVVDGGTGGGVVVVAAAERTQTQLCEAIAAPLVAAGIGATVQVQAAGVADPTLDDVVCRLDP